MKNTMPTVIQDILNCNVSVHHYATRAQSSSLLYRYANDGYSSSYSHYVCTVWNHLPISMRNTTSLSMFTKLIKLHLTSFLLFITTSIIIMILILIYLSTTFFYFLFYF